jgi:predicted esterase
MNTFDYIKKLSLNKNAKIIVMLHGVGSNKEDLF